MNIFLHKSSQDWRLRTFIHIDLYHTPPSLFSNPRSSPSCLSLPFFLISLFSYRFVGKEGERRGVSPTWVPENTPGLRLHAPQIPILNQKLRSPSISFTLSHFLF